MKRIILFFFSTILLTGCSMKTENTQSEITSNNFNITNTNIGFANNTANLNDTEIKLLRFQKTPAPKDSVFETPYLEIEFDITNKSNNNIPLNEAWIKAIDVSQKYNLPKVSITEKGKELPNTDRGVGEDTQPIKPHETLHGIVTYALENEDDNHVTITLKNGINGEKVGSAELNI